MAFTEKTIIRAVPAGKRKALGAIQHEPESGIWYIELADGWYDYETAGAMDWRTVTDLDKCTTQFTVDDGLTASEASMEIRYQFEYIHQANAED